MRRFQRILWCALVVAFVAWCVHALHADLAQLSFAPILKSWDVVLLATLLSLLNYAARSVRWHSYLERLGHRMSLGFASLTYIAGFAFTLSPGKVGEMARAPYYAPMRVPVAHVAAAFFVERLMDLLAMLVLACLILTISDRYTPAMWGAAGAIATILVLLGALPWARIAAATASSPRVPRALRTPISTVAQTLATSRVLLRPATLLFGFTIALVAWGLEGLGLGLLGSMFSPSHLTWTSALGIYAVAVLIGALSFLPGGLGSTEAIMTALLAVRGYPVGQALLITLACRVVTLWLAVGIGWIAVLALRRETPALVLPWR